MTRPRARLVVCGDPSRGDDGAARAAVTRLRGEVPDDVETRVVTGLDPTDLLDLDDVDLVIADTVVGVEPGEVWVRAIDEIGEATGAARFPSTHTLSLPDTLALAAAIEGARPHGCVVAIGGRDFAVGAPLSPPVEAGLDDFGARILSALGPGQRGT